jgi:hypothetical protein
MGSSQSHDGGDEADIPRDLDNDVREMYAIGEPASGTGSSQSQSGGAKRSRRQTRHASTKSAAKSKGSYAAVRKTRRR